MATGNSVCVFVPADVEDDLLPVVDELSRELGAGETEATERREVVEGEAPALAVVPDAVTSGFGGSVAFAVESFASFFLCGNKPQPAQSKTPLQMRNEAGIFNAALYGRP